MSVATWRSPTSCGPLHPDLEIDWLTQDPVTRVLAERGERVHPASRWLASESAHIESEAGEHDLHVFQAVRAGWTRSWSPTSWSSPTSSTTSPTTCGSSTRDGTIDHFLFDNPELKRTAYAWLTDFVGWLPMPDGGAAEAALTAD